MIDVEKRDSAEEERAPRATAAHPGAAPDAGGATFTFADLGSLAMQTVVVRNMDTGQLVPTGELGATFEGPVLDTLLPIRPLRFTELKWPPVKSMSHISLEKLAAMWPESFNARPPW